jgi:phytanoyl-CoA hydroxylase
MRYINDVRLSPDQITFYRENGYVIIPNILSPQHLEAWREMVDSAVGERSWRMPNKDQEDSTNVEEEFYHNVFTQRVNLWQSNPKMRELLFDIAPIIGRISSELEGDPTYRLWHDQALYKEPFANATSLHIDAPFWSFETLNAISMWVALDNATMQNGCMYMLQGSHTLIKNKTKREGSFKEIKIAQNMNQLFDAYPETRECVSVPVEMPAGSCSFHSGVTVHGAGPNMSNKRRRAMTYQMYPDGCTFNGKKNILTQERFDVLRVGDVLNDDENNPKLV